MNIELRAPDAAFYDAAVSWFTEPGFLGLDLPKMPWTRENIQAYMGAKSDYLWAIWEDGKPVGVASVSDWDRYHGSIMVHSRCCAAASKRTAIVAGSKLMAWCFDTLKVHTCWTLKLGEYGQHEAAGFRHVGFLKDRFFCGKDEEGNSHWASAEIYDITEAEFRASRLHQRALRQGEAA